MYIIVLQIHIQHRHIYENGYTICIFIHIQSLNNPPEVVLRMNSSLNGPGHESSILCIHCDAIRSEELENFHEPIT